MPLEPEAFRRQMTKQTADVDRPLKAVAATFRERAPACLKVSTRSQAGPGMRYAITVLHYNPKVMVTDTRVELHLQVRYEGPTLYDQGHDGAYIYLVHATAVDARRTRLEIWKGGLSDTAALDSAVKGWASGTFAGCPALE
jgi:hypothetical protein